MRSSSKKSRVSKNQSNSVKLVPLQMIVSHMAALFICFHDCLIMSLVLNYGISVIVV